MAAKITLVYEVRHVKEFRVTGNLNKSNTEMIMANTATHIEMRTKVIYSFKSEIYRRGGEIVPYYKTLTSPPGIFTNLEEIQAYIEEYEQKRLDLDKEEVWSKAYLPAKRTIEARGNYEGKVVFKHVQIRLVASNETLMGCGPLPDWLRDKRCIYAIDTFDDNLCVWRCLAIYKRHVRGEKIPVEKANCRTALNLASEYYGHNKLKQKDARPTKLINFKDIAKHYSVNIMLYEPTKDRGKDAGSICRLVYGMIQHKNNLPIINMGLLGGHCFCIMKMDMLCIRWECKGCRQIFTRDENLIRHHLKEERFQCANFMDVIGMDIHV